MKKYEKHYRLELTQSEYDKIHMAARARSMTLNDYVLMVAGLGNHNKERGLVQAGSWAISATCISLRMTKKEHAWLKATAKRQMCTMAFYLRGRLL